MASRVSGRIEIIPISSEQDLTIDIASFGPENARRILLHSSGLHGVEGFAGSAIQLQLLDNFPALPPDTALILVHILNPYGMAWLRRVNAGNVDLNRNFLIGEEHSGAPQAYAELDSFLNPRTPPSRDFYFLKSAWLIFRRGMPALKQAVVGGQYEYPRGLFFGGRKVEEELEKYGAFLRRSLSSAEYVIAMDVHTGLGKFGEETLLVESGNYETLRKGLSSRVVPLEAESGPAYRIRGGLQNLVFQGAPHAKVHFIGEEFGTYPAAKVLHALREENRWHHYGDAAKDHAVKRTLKDTFCPPSESWRRSVLERGAELIHRAIRL